MQQKAATTPNHNKHQPYLGQQAPFFHSWRVLSNIGKWAIGRQGEPTIVVAVLQNIARIHGTHHKGSRKAPATANHNKHQPYLGQLPPFFHSCWRVLSNTGKWAIGRQGEPTIVVAVPQNIARDHGTHHKCSRMSLASAVHNKHQPYLGQLPPFFHSWRVLSNTGKWAIGRQGEPTIVVAVPQNIARDHGTHHKGRRRERA